ncbi:MAG: hypothetical protein J6113_01640 [Lachnospiraceae bacterium]|nr:hypothetical protein [Lachnospiraceae bacterium]
MLEEDIIKQNIEPEDLQNLEDALVANLDGLYDSGFAEGEPDEESENTEYEGPRIVEDPETGEVFSVESDGIRTDEREKEARSNGDQKSADGFSEDAGAPDITEADDAIFNDINDALASQIKAEIRREKRIKKFGKSKWWLLSLIPLLGIFVLMIRPLRKNMPKWFMILRTVIFVAFAIEMIGVVVSDGHLLFYQIASYSEKHMGKELQNKDFSKAAAGAGTLSLSGVSTETKKKAAQREGFLNTLFIVESADEGRESTLFAAVLSLEKVSGEAKLCNILPGAVLNIGGKKLSISEAVKQERFEDVKEALITGFGLYTEGYIYLDIKAVTIFVDKLGGIVINSNTFDGAATKKLFEEKTDETPGFDELLAAERKVKILNGIISSINGLDHKDRFLSLRTAFPYMHAGISKSRLAELIGVFAKNTVEAPGVYVISEINDTDRLTKDLNRFLYGDEIKDDTSEEGDK